MLLEVLWCVKWITVKFMIMVAAVLKIKNSYVDLLEILLVSSGT